MQLKNPYHTLVQQDFTRIWSTIKFIIRNIFSLSFLLFKKIYFRPCSLQIEMIQWHLIRRHSRTYFLWRKVALLEIHSFLKFPTLSWITVTNIIDLQLYFSFFLRFSFSLKIMFLPSFSLTLNIKNLQKSSEHAKQVLDKEKEYIQRSNHQFRVSLT